MFCTTGVCCVLQPWTDGLKVGLEPIIFGYVFSIIAGILETIEIILIQRYSLNHPVEKANAVLFWMYLTGTILSIIGVLALEEILIPTAWTDWMLVFVHCAAFGFIMAIGINFFPYVPSVLVTLITSTSTVYMVIAQYTFMAHFQRGNHNWIEICGVLIVLTSSIFPSLITAVKASNQNNTGG